MFTAEFFMGVFAGVVLTLGVLSLFVIAGGGILNELAGRGGRK